MSDFTIGQKVTVRCRHHRQNGNTGTIVYLSKFMGTWGVEIDGRTYGLFASELEAAA